MVSSAALEQMLAAAEAGEARARATEERLKAAMQLAKAERVEFAAEAQTIRTKLARTTRRDCVGKPLEQAGPPRPSPPAPAPVKRKLGRPAIAGCFQCRFLARGGAVGRRGGKAHTCGGPGSAEYQRWARVRAAERAKTLAGRGVPVRGKGKKAALPRK